MWAKECKCRSDFSPTTVVVARSVVGLKSDLHVHLFPISHMPHGNEEVAALVVFLMKRVF